MLANAARTQKAAAADPKFRRYEFGSDAAGEGEKEYRRKTEARWHDTQNPQRLKPDRDNH